MEVKSIIFFFSSLFIFSCSLSTINNKEKPNIVFISIDDLNDWVGFLDMMMCSLILIWIGWPKMVFPLLMLTVLLQFAVHLEQQF